MSPPRKAVVARPPATVSEPDLAAGDRQRKAASAFRTISEVSDELQIAKHVLRFWEIKFTQLRPMKRGGGRRFYRPDDVELLRGIRHLLQAEAFTIKGVQKILREQGVEAVKQSGAVAAQTASSRAAGRKARAAVGQDTAAIPAPRRAAAPLPVSTTGSAASRDALKAALRAAIVELEACRALLVAPVVAPAAGSRSARARP